MKKILLITFFYCYLIRLSAQALDYQNMITVILDDGTPVTLYGRAGDERMTRSDSVNMKGMAFDVAAKPGTASTVGNYKINSSVPEMKYSDDYYFSGDYYYLPTNLRLGTKPKIRPNDEATPEFLFLKYTTEERTDAGGIQGALMHFLMEWGLSPKQEEDLQQKVAARVNELKNSAGLKEKFSKVTKAVVAGPVRLKADDNSFRIISATLSDKTLAPTVITSGKAPTLPGQKAAVASRLDKNGAQLLAATFEKTRSISDVSLELRYKYNVLMPAFKGFVTIDYSKMEGLYQELVKNGTVKQDDKDDEDNHFDIKGKDELVRQMISAKVVDVSLTDMSTDNPNSKILIDAVMGIVLASMSAEGKDAKGKTQFEEKEDKSDEGKTGNVNIDIKRLRSRMERGKEIINLNYRMAISEEVVLTGNLGSWYNKVRDNPKCISTVNLNDKFFQHRDVNVILDLDAEDMFGKEVNFVTVNVRKKRKAIDKETGEKVNDYSEAVTFDRKFMEKGGNRYAFTYSKAQDEDPDTYEYKTKWSLRGGNEFPVNDTSWTKGTWQGLTLSPPVKPRPIKFETDLDELKELGIKNVTLQLRYKKFGKEEETLLNIPVSSNVSSTEKTIYMDRNTQGYAYRYIFTHKESGPLATEWDAKVNTDYIYAIIPKALRAKDQTVLDKMIEAGKIITTMDTKGNISKEQQVLDKFKKVIDVFDDKKK
jgi:hypothetical protein